LPVLRLNFIAKCYSIVCRLQRRDTWIGSFRRNRPRRIALRGSIYVFHVSFTSAGAPWCLTTISIARHWAAR
jgi:hypothetical protein